MRKQRVLEAACYVIGAGAAIMLIFETIKNICIAIAAN